MKRLSPYEIVWQMKEEPFRRLTGVKKNTFSAMVLVLTKAEQQKRSRGGHASRMKLEDQLLMTLEYLREYRTYFHIGQRYGVSESDCYRKCTWVENTLIHSRVFRLPGKKEVLKNPMQYEVVLVDATESPIERPKKKSEKTNESSTETINKNRITRERKKGIR